MIDLGERIKLFRQRGGRTQEALAGELGVTAQAVSRWENGVCYPDMELIPSLANAFGISIDELFGYENEREKRIDALAERIIDMNRKNNGVDECMDECIALARSALIEFPGNEKLMFALASALFNAGYVRRGEMHIESVDGFDVYDVEAHRAYPEWQEAVKLYEKLLQTLPCGEMRQQATVELSQLYKNLGESEKALALAASAPRLDASSAYLRINAFDGKAGVAACGEALIETVRCGAELMRQIVWSDRTLPPETAARMLENALGLFKLVCADGDAERGIEDLRVRIELLRSYYLWLASDRDEAFSALDNALEHAHNVNKMSCRYKQSFTSPLLRHVCIENEPLFDCAGRTAELPDVWPWWSVPDRDRVRTEMEKDPRWQAWVEKTQKMQ